MTISEPVQIRWADIDANRHLRHSVYYDYGAAMRIHVLSSRGLTSKMLEELQIGPVLFREECIFKREIQLEDKITLTLELVKATPDFGRWSLRHQFLKEDGTVAAILNMDGAWIDLVKRKLAQPNDLIQKIFDSFPRAADFELIIKEPKKA